MKNKIARVVVFVAACELVGGIGALFTAPSIGGWYAGLNKAGLNPPGWVFGPVWTILFALMGVAAALVWAKGIKNKAVVLALKFFVFQLALNALWSILFFGLHAPSLALLDIVVLWLAIILTTWRFWKICRPAGRLMLPYLLWVSFAIYLNYSVVVLNR